MFRFRNHPALISVTEGVQDALEYLRASWHIWLPMVLLVAASNFALYSIVSSTSANLDAGSLYYTDPYTGQIVWYPDVTTRLWTVIGPLLVVLLAQLVIGIVAGWVYTATAISGLRNRPLTVSAIVYRGLLTIVAGLLIFLAAAAVFVALALLVILMSPIAVLLFLAAIPVAIYFAIRLILVTLAVFDGFGPLEAIQESWRLSRGSVMRLFGWGLMAVVLQIGFSLVSDFLSAPFSSGARPLGQGLAAAVTGTGAVMLVYFMAVLYESERARKDPYLGGYGPLPLPVYGGAPGPYGPYPGGPAPYSPGPYPPPPYAGGPYVPGPYAGAPSGWPPPPPIPGAWESGAPSEIPPAAPQPPQPPASPESS